MLKIYNPREAGMTINFADGTHIEIAATAFDDFVKHDLKWAEFVHGRALVKEGGLLQRIVAPTGSRSHKPRTQRFILARRAAAEKPQHLTTDDTDRTDLHG